MPLQSNVLGSNDRVAYAIPTLVGDLIDDPISSPSTNRRGGSSISSVWNTPEPISLTAIDQADDPFIDRSQTVPIPHTSGVSSPRLPTTLSRKLPPVRPGDLAPEASESDLAMDSSPSVVKGRTKTSPPRHSISDSQAEDSGDDEVNIVESASVFEPDETNGSDTDYLPPGRKKQANKSLKGSRSKAKNTATQKPMQVNKVATKASTRGARADNTGTNPKPATTNARQKPKANKGKSIAVEAPPDVDESRQEAAAAGDVQRHTSPSTQIKRMEVSKSTASGSRPSNKTTQHTQIPPARRVPKKPFFPVSDHQPSQLGAEIADDAFDVPANSPGPSVPAIPTRSKTAKSGKAVKTKVEKKPASKGSLAKVPIQEESKVKPAKPSLREISKPLASTGSSSKKKSIRQYGSKASGSKASGSKSNVNSMISTGADDDPPLKPARMECEPTEEPEPSRTSVGESSTSDDNERHARSRDFSIGPIGGDVQQSGKRMPNAFDRGTSITSPIHISSDRDFETTDTGGSTSEDHSKVREETKAGLTSNHSPAPIVVNVQHMESSKIRPIPGMMEGVRQTVQLKLDNESHQAPVACTSDSLVDKTQGKRKMTTREVESAGKKRARIATSSSDTLAPEVKVGPLDASHEPVSPDPQQIRDFPVHGGPVRLVGEASHRIEPRAVVKEQPMFSQQVNKNASGLFTIYEDRSQEARIISPVEDGGFSTNQKRIEIPFHKHDPSRATASLLHELGSPIQPQSRSDNLASVYQGKASSIRTPLQDIQHIPIDGHTFTQEAGTSSMSRTSAMPILPTNALRSADRQQRGTATDKLADTLYSVVDNIMSHLGTKETAVENVVVEYTHNVRKAMFGLKEVHHQELGSLANRYGQERSDLVRHYERLSDNLRSMREADSSRNATKICEDWRKQHGQRMQSLRDSLLKK